ncbi:MAG: hypothetical protein ABSB50_09550 [Terracidiphilus sp.]|jgi:hypothetical protein
MIKHLVFGALIILSIGSIAPAQQKQASANVTDRIVLGHLANGATVTFVRTASGEWGIDISGNAVPHLTQPKPAQIEVYRGEGNVRELSAGYRSVQKEPFEVVAKARVGGSGAASFAVEDRWRIAGDVLSLSRSVAVTGDDANAGFYSAIRFVTATEVSWADAGFLAPGLLYGEPHTRATAPGGSAFYNARCFSIREDYLSAPLFGLSFRDGRWVALMDLAPHGDTTAAETTAHADTPIIDEHLRFGALGAREDPEGGIEFGFWLPGTTNEFSGGFGFGSRPATPITALVRRRYNPVKAGFTQNYQVGFRFGAGDSLLGVERDAWRWAWQTLNPPVMHLDLDVVRQTLIDHLADRVLVVDGRAGIPFVTDSVSGKPGSFRPALLLAQDSFFSHVPPPPDLADIVRFAHTLGIEIDPKAAELDLWPKITMGFCGKNIEAAGQFLREADRDPGPRGRRLRKLGLMIIDSFLRFDPASPVLAGEGFDLRTGKASAVRGEPSFALRATGEGMRAMLDDYRYEHAHGRQHPEWFAWVKSYSDWLLTQQREDGSFPESFQGGTGKAINTSGATSYAPVPLLAEMTSETGDKEYLDAAVRAANYIWTNFGSRGVYVGATGGDAADKESGMLSMDAFLALFDTTREPKWLYRAKMAGDYAETYIWLWNVPMAPGLPDTELGWKHGVSTVGVTGIASNVPGEVDEYLDWAAPSYARLYEASHDQHYLDVARVLVFDTKSMLALPGRTYDLLGPGWQQEHWRMGPGVRGIGAHRTWLPWISVNHLHSITGLEEFDPALYRSLAKGN